MKGRPVPPLAEDRRLRACVHACEHISTEQLEAGLVRDALEKFGQLHIAMALAADIVAQGKNPADYLDLAGIARHASAIGARLEASGFAEAMNQAWEQRTGELLDDQPPAYLVPLSGRRAA